MIGRILKTIIVSFVVKRITQYLLKPKSTRK